MGPEDLKKRTKEFAHRCVKLALALPKDVLGDHLRKQLIRCSTSVASNYRASLHAQSKAAFIAKISIVIEEAAPFIFTLHILMKDNKRLTLRLSGLELLAANTKWDSTARASRSHALRGNAYRKALPSICESRSPYDPHACMYPTTEAEPLRTHSQAEPGNERFSTLSRLMSMAELLELIRKDFIAKKM